MKSSLSSDDDDDDESLTLALASESLSSSDMRTEASESSPMSELVSLPKDASGHTEQNKWYVRELNHVDTNMCSRHEKKGVAVGN